MSWDAGSKLEQMEQGYTTGSYRSRSWEHLRSAQEKYSPRGLRSFQDIAYNLCFANEDQGIETIRKLLKSSLRTMPYADFLKTRYWDELRSLVIARRGPRCAGCGGDFDKLQLHHKSYEHRGFEIDHLEDVQLLCDPCHEAKHK